MSKQDDWFDPLSIIDRVFHEHVATANSNKNESTPQPNQEPPPGIVAADWEEE